MPKRSKTLKTISTLIKAVVILAAIGVLFFVIENNFAFSGTKTFVYNFKKDSNFISHLEPWERLSPIMEEGPTYFQEMKDDTVYFNVKKPGDFEKIKVTITYKNPEASILDIGLRINKKDNYTKLPLEAKIIDGLKWSKINREETELFQKNKDFDSIDEFLSSFPKEKKVIAHNFDIKKHVPEEQVIKENITPLRNDINLDGIDYLITKYNTPIKKDGWKVALGTFEFKNAYVDDDQTIRFMLTAPGLKTAQSTIKIDQIEVQFERPPLTTKKVIQKIRTFFKI